MASVVRREGIRRIRAALTWGLAVVMAGFGAGVPEAGAHGQRVLPVFIDVLSGESIRIDVSFDAMFVRAAEPVDRAWFTGLSEREIGELAGDAERFLRTMLSFEMGGRRLDLEAVAPDIQQLRDPGFDNGEPEGHFMVSFSGALDPSGGPLTMTLEEMANMPSVVATVTLDGKPRRRPVVAITGETRPVCDVPALPGEVGGMVAAEAGEPGFVPPVSEDGVPVGEGIERLPQPEVRAFVELGWRHVMPRGWDHWLLAMVVFSVAVGWRALLLQWGVLAAGSLAGSLVVVPALAGVPEWAGLAVIALLGVEGALPGRASVKPWRLGALFVLGFTHSDVFAAGTPSAAGRAATLGYASGVEFAHAVLLFGGFVLLGWAWSEAWYSRRVLRPLSAAAAVGTVALLVARLAAA